MTYKRVHVRRRAAQMLLVWLLTLVSGLLNACMVTSGQMHGWAVMSTSAAPPSSGPGGRCSDCSQAGRANVTLCGKFCSDASGGVPAAELGFDAGVGVILAPLPTLCLALANSADRGDGVVAVSPAPLLWAHSIPITFLRLTL